MSKAAHLAAFEWHVASLTRKFTKKRSSLRKLFDFLEAQDPPRPFTSPDAVFAQCNNPRDSRLQKYRAAVVVLYRVWGTNQPYARPAPATGLSAAIVNAVKGSLDVCKGFACSDVGTFRHDINKALSPRQQQAIYDLGTTAGRSTGVAIVARQPGGVAGDWNRDALRTAANQVLQAQAGECTSYARYAAHFLSTAHPFAQGVTPRIEIVSYNNTRKVPRKNRDGTPLMKRDANGAFTDQPVMANQYVTHVFCLIGRRGADVAGGGIMPDKSTWGPDVRIVDCWLAALGYESTFTVRDYPKQGYMTAGKLKLEMNSRMGPGAIN